MATTIIHSADILDFNPLPNPQSLSPLGRVAHSGEFVTSYHPKVGEIRFKSLLFPHMHVMNLHWLAQEDLIAHESMPADTININFHMAGRQDTTFEGISHDLNMRAGRHNLVFSPGAGYVNRIIARDAVEMFHISLDKGFFANVIGYDDHWSEKAQDHLFHDRPFAGMAGTMEVTPQMFRLIKDIKQCRDQGAMRNLLIQSKVLELLALQIDQFRGNARSAEGLSAVDTDKLYQLKHFLDVQFLEDYSLAELSRVCLLNEFKVKKGFKELFGTTVFGYLRKLRMDYAERLLLDSSCTVEEVSDALGYEHAQHFSTAFKKFHGISPSNMKSGRSFSDM